MGLAERICAEDYRPKKQPGTCALCSSALEVVLDLGEQPLANGLLTTKDEPYKTYPLRLGECRSCKHVQLLDLVPPSEMFGQYVYRTGASAPAVKHFKGVASRLREMLFPGAKVYEIGSGDGTLLTAMRKHGLSAIGIDPSSAGEGVEGTEPYFLDPACVTYLRGQHGDADCVVLCNVLAHTGDPQGMLTDAAALLKPGGLLVIEAPYLHDMIRNGDWSSCYHEHVHYFRFTALLRMLTGRFYLLETEHLSVHGGSLRLWARKRPCPSSHINANAYRFMDEGRPDWVRFRERIARNVERLRKACEGSDFLIGIGAAAKATVILNYCGLKPEFVIDTTPEKHWKFIPGVGVKIVPDGTLTTGLCTPDRVLMLAFNYRDHFFEKYPYLDGKWVIPFPDEG